MSELDRWFPREPKDKPPELPPRPNGDEVLARGLASSNRWHCEERIKSTLEAFFECWPELIPGSRDGLRLHYPAARYIVNEIGEMEAPAFVRWAKTVCESEAAHITVKTARSLAWLLGRWRLREKPDPNKWWTKSCPKCCTFHHPDGPCNGEEADE